MEADKLCDRQMWDVESPAGGARGGSGGGYESGRGGEQGRMRKEVEGEVEEEDGGSKRKTRRMKMKVPAEPSKPVMKVTLVSGFPIYSL